MNCLTSSRIATNPWLAAFYREGAEPAQLNPVSVSDSINNFFKHRIHNTFDVPLVQMRVLVSDRLDQL